MFEPSVCSALALKEEIEPEIVFMARRIPCNSSTSSETIRLYGPLVEITNQIHQENTCQQSINFGINNFNVACKLMGKPGDGVGVPTRSRLMLYIFAKIGRTDLPEL